MYLAKLWSNCAHAISLLVDIFVDHETGDNRKTTKRYIYRACLCKVPFENDRIECFHFYIFEFLLLLTFREDDEDIAEDVKDVAPITSFFTSKTKEKEIQRHKFFKERHLEQVASL